jgi:hypothetical protein
MLFIQKLLDIKKLLFNILKKLILMNNKDLYVISNDTFRGIFDTDSSILIIIYNHNKKNNYFVDRYKPFELLNYF